MNQLNQFFYNHPELKKFKPLIKKLFSKKDISAIFLCGSRSKNTPNKKRDLSDFDFFLITTENISKMQAIHYHLGDLRLELMFYHENFFLNPSSYDKNLLNKILNGAELIFSKNEKIKKYFFTYSNSLLKKDISDSELESMWFKLVWNLLKVKSYEKEDKELAEILSIQNYFFIGLFYGRLCGEKVYNLSESVKYMKKTNPSFFEKYSNLLEKKEKRIKIEKLIQLLPNSKKYLNKKSLIELDNFVSPLTVVGEQDNKIVNYKKEIDKIVTPLLKLFK